MFDSGYPPQAGTQKGIAAITNDIQMRAAINTVNMVTPALVKYHPGVCKAWVNFDGTGTVAIRESHNVSSITDLGTGNYIVNFSSPMANTSYVGVFNAKPVVGSAAGIMIAGPRQAGTQTASAYQVSCSSTGTYEDCVVGQFIAFGSI